MTLGRSGCIHIEAVVGALQVEVTALSILNGEATVHILDGQNVSSNMTGDLAVSNGNFRSGGIAVGLIGSQGAHGQIAGHDHIGAVSQSCGQTVSLGDKVVEGNGNFLALSVLQSCSQLVVDILSSGGEFNRNHVVLTGLDLDIFCLVNSPGDGVGYIVDADLADHSVVNSSLGFGVFVHGVQIFLCGIQTCVFFNLGCTAGEAADHHGQEQQRGNYFFHN